ncbi:S1 RNA-binding domain-containing protein [Streptomyces sp. NPDC004230]
MGQRLSGRVTKLVPFGAFVQVADGIEGLVHLSELSSVPVAAPEDVAEVGDQLTDFVAHVELLTAVLRRSAGNDSHPQVARIPPATPLACRSPRR